MTKGCEGFLAYLITDNNSEISLGDIQVVKEISDVFPEKLPDLSSDWEIEYSIDLFPGTVPISKPPYRMVLFL